MRIENNSRIWKSVLEIHEKAYPDGGQEELDLETLDSQLG